MSRRIITAVLVAVALISVSAAVLRNLVRWVDREHIESVGLTKVGAGLGKLSWQIEAKPLMEAYFASSTCRFVIDEDSRKERRVC